MKSNKILKSENKTSKSILWVCYIAAAIVLMDLTSVNIALPTISAYYGIGLDQVSWLLMASMLSAASFAIIAGRIIDRFEVRSILIIGFLIFILGTTTCFFIDQFETLIIIRFIQGFGEALLYVVGPAYISKHLPPKKQQSAYGIWMAFTAVGISFGPVIGGLLLSEFNWHSVFLINSVLSIIGLVIILNSKKQGITKKIEVLDYLGAFYSFMTLASIIYALNMIHKKGVGDMSVIISFVLFLIFVVLFIQRERNTANPILNFKLLSIRNFNIAALGFFLFFVVNVGSRFLRPFYFENVKVLTPQSSGLLMMVSPLIMMIVAPFSKSISKLMSHKLIIILANILLAASMLWFSLWNAQTSLMEIIIAMILLGLAMGLYYPTNSYIGMNSLPEGKSGMGSAFISTSKSMGKLIGVLLFAVCFTMVSESANTEEHLRSAYSYTFILGVIIAFFGVLISIWIKSRSIRD
jgi:EmrB/QacA subfamily drug resistance transporter